MLVAAVFLAMPYFIYICWHSELTGEVCAEMERMHFANIYKNRSCDADVNIIDLDIDGSDTGSGKK